MIPSDFGDTIIIMGEFCCIVKLNVCVYVSCFFFLYIKYLFITVVVIVCLALFFYIIISFIYYTYIIVVIAKEHVEIDKTNVSNIYGLTTFHQTNFPID